VTSKKLFHSSGKLHKSATGSAIIESISGAEALAPKSKPRLWVTNRKAKGVRPIGR